MNNIPYTVGALGSSIPTKWIYSEYGRFLNVYGVTNGINITFNLDSSDDIRSKLNYLYNLRDIGKCHPDDISELEERIRTLSSFIIRGRGDATLAGISESSGKGKVVTVYRDGKPVKVTKRGKYKVATDAQKRAAENARRYAHTEEANKKRRKSISARGDGKILGDV